MIRVACNLCFVLFHVFFLFKHRYSLLTLTTKTVTMMTTKALPILATIGTIVTEIGD